MEQEADAARLELESILTNFQQLLRSSRIGISDVEVGERSAHELPESAEEFVEAMEAVGRDKFHSKVFAENLVLSIELVLVRVHRLKLRYALYGPVSQDLSKELTQRTKNINDCLERIQNDAGKVVDDINRSLLKI